MRRALLLLTVLSLCSCAGPEPGDTGYVLLDPAARAAGLSVDTGDGRGPITSALPIPVSAHEGATLVGASGHATLTVAPGETVEVKDARGTLVRGTARADRLVVRGGHAETEALAQMLGARLVVRADGTTELAGDDVLFAAALYGDMRGIDAVSVLLAGASTEDTAPWALGAAPSEAAAMPVSEGRIGVATEAVAPAVVESLDPASLVGLYETHGASLLVDAAGGYTLHGHGVDTHGTWSARGGRLVLVADGRTEGVTIAVTDGANELRDDASGLVLRPAGFIGCRIPYHHATEDL